MSILYFVLEMRKMVVNMVMRDIWCAGIFVHDGLLWHCWAPI